MKMALHTACRTLGSNRNPVHERLLIGRCGRATVVPLEDISPSSMSHVDPQIYCSGAVQLIDEGE